MLVNLAAGFAGLIVFLFIFWKRLKEDYSPEIIFKSASYILTGILIGWLLSFKFLPAGFLWLEFFGGLTGLTLSAVSFRVRFYETFEALVISALPWVSFLFLKDSVVNSSLISFIAFLSVLVFIFIFYYLDIHYKSFTWYASGKIGFAGLATMSLIFIVRSGLALSQISVLSFLIGYETLASGVAALVSLLLLFNLGIPKK